MTALPIYETSEAVLPIHFKDVAFAMVCHSEMCCAADGLRWPCNLMALQTDGPANCKQLG